MSFHTEEVSVESLFDSMFDKNNVNFAFESQKYLDKEDFNILKDNSLEEIELVVKTQEHIANANMLRIGLEAFEKFVWSKEAEEDSDVKDGEGKGEDKTAKKDPKDEGEKKAPETDESDDEGKNEVKTDKKDSKDEGEGKAKLDPDKEVAVKQEKEKKDKKKEIKRNRFGNTTTSDDEVEPAKKDDVATGAAATMESTSTEKKKESIWRRFWNWLKRIFQEIKLAVVSFFKRVHISLAGNMRKYAIWYKENAPQYGGGIKMSEVTLKIKLPKVKFDTYFGNMKNDLDEAVKLATTFANDMEGVSDHTKKMLGSDIENTDYYKKANDFKEKAKKVSTTSLNKLLYGNNKAKVVTAKEFFDYFPFEKLKEPREVKKYLETSSITIKATSKSIKGCVRAMEVKESSVRKAIKSTGNGLQIGLNTITTGLVWATSEHIKLMNICYRFSVKAVKEIKGSK